MMKVRRVAGSAAIAKPTHRPRADIVVPKLPEELVEEILLRVPPDEPAHLVRAGIVCKAWKSIISDDTFVRRYRRFHRTPPMQGYFYNDFTETKTTIGFVPTTSTAVSAAYTPSNFYNSSSRISSVLDCRHGRVLIHQAKDCLGPKSRDRLIVWDPISGSQQHLREPDYPQYPFIYVHYVAAVLCAQNNCNHVDCHGGPFLIVFVVSGYQCYNNNGEFWKTWASMYSSETGAWSASMTRKVRTSMPIARSPSLLVGDALYFNTQFGGYDVIKYDLCKHELSVIRLPGNFEAILMKGFDDVLALATMFHNCIHTLFSWKLSTNGNGRSLEYTILKLRDTLLPIDYHKTDLICAPEGTNTVFIRIQDRGLFSLDLKSRQVRQICEKETNDHGVIFPYMSFYTPKY